VGGGSGRDVIDGVDEAFAVLGVAKGASLDEIRLAWRNRARQVHPDVGGDAREMQALNDAYQRCCQWWESRQTAPVVEPEVMRRDAPSFVVEALPVVAFEALLVATSWLGEVLVDDPPYLLEVHLLDPSPCWCRLELVPDAGATTVSLTVADVEGSQAPSVLAVRDRWIAVLNELPLPE
jgi:hypothetical protein